MADLNPGEIRISGHGNDNGGAPPQKPRFLTLRWIIALVVFAALCEWGYRVQQRSTAAAAPAFPNGHLDCSDSGSPCKNLLPPAPPSGRFAAFTLRDDPGAVAFVVGSARVIIHVVHSRSEVPVEIRQSAMAIPPAPSRGRLGTRPVIFTGDVDIDTGPIVDDDHMVETLRLTNDRIQEVNVLYQPARPRGPPDGTGQAVEVYVVGTARSFAGPEQRERSVLEATVIDLPLAPTTAEWTRYEEQRKEWEDAVALRKAITERDGIVRSRATGEKGSPFEVLHEALHEAPHTVRVVIP